jgi:phytoene/squalene synthetase
MTNPTAALARSITWASSKQSYLTARLLADHDLADDCLRAYAYFRWADDRIDICLSGKDECTAFVERQKALINSLYRGESPQDLLPEEAMLADLIAHERRANSGLRSFICNFMSVIEFDAYRKGRTASRHELAAYTTCLATAVMDGIQYFIGNEHAYQKTDDRNLAVTGAHITHMLRDMKEDLSAKLINIPAEDLEAYGINIEDTSSESFRRWVRAQVEMARSCFREGKVYIGSLDVLRCKLAGVWYCARFECILKTIERDGYRLRAKYHDHRGWMIWLEMARLGAAVTIKHFAGRIRFLFLPIDHQTELNSKWKPPLYHIK